MQFSLFIPINKTFRSKKAKRGDGRGGKGRERLRGGGIKFETFLLEKPKSNNTYCLLERRKSCKIYIKRIVKALEVKTQETVAG